MLSARGHRRNVKLPIRCPFCSRTGHSASKCREFQITRREKKPNGYQRDGKQGDRNGEGGGNGRDGVSGGVGGNRAGGGNKNRTGGGGNARTNFGAGSLVATSTRPTLAARGAPREWHEDEYWVANSGATENMTQDSSNVEDYTPPPPRRRGRKPRRGISPCCRIWTPTTPGGRRQRHLQRSNAQANS